MLRKIITRGISSLETVQKYIEKWINLAYNKNTKRKECDMITDSLFTKPSFMGGIASIVDLEGLSFFNYSDTPEGADEKALRSDWEMVGQDLRGALAVYGEQA